MIGIPDMINGVLISWHEKQEINQFNAYRHIACTHGVQWMTVVWDSDSGMGQLPKPLYNCQNVTQMNMLLHFSPRHYKLWISWYSDNFKMGLEAVAIPHHCHPLYTRHNQICIQYILVYLFTLYNLTGYKLILFNILWYFALPLEIYMSRI